MKLKKDDTVQLMYGPQKVKGKRGRVLSVNREDETVVVEGLNIRFKHVRRSQRNPQGGRLSKEMPIHQSKVMLVCQKCQTPTRVKTLIKDDGSKFRVCKKCNEVISQVSPPSNKGK